MTEFVDKVRSIVRKTAYEFVDSVPESTGSSFDERREAADLATKTLLTFYDDMERTLENISENTKISYIATLVTLSRIHGDVMMAALKDLARKFLEKEKEKSNV